MTETRETTQRDRRLSSAIVHLIAELRRRAGRKPAFVLRGYENVAGAVPSLVLDVQGGGDYSHARILLTSDQVAELHRALSHAVAPWGNPMPGVSRLAAVAARGREPVPEALP
jgi:hypothetical protein